MKYTRALYQPPYDACFPVQDVIADRFLNFFLRQRTIQKKNYVVFISQDKTNNKETSGMAKNWIINGNRREIWFSCSKCLCFCEK